MVQWQPGQSVEVPPAWARAPIRRRRLRRSAAPSRCLHAVRAVTHGTPGPPSRRRRSCRSSRSPTRMHRAPQQAARRSRVPRRAAGRRRAAPVVPDQLGADAGRVAPRRAARGRGLATGGAT
jgi:hypothetical protein